MGIAWAAQPSSDLVVEIWTARAFGDSDALLLVCEKSYYIHHTDTQSCVRLPLPYICVFPQHVTLNPEWYQRSKYNLAVGIELDPDPGYDLFRGVF